MPSKLRAHEVTGAQGAQLGELERGGSGNGKCAQTRCTPRLGRAKSCPDTLRTAAAVQLQGARRRRHSVGSHARFFWCPLLGRSARWCLCGERSPRWSAPTRFWPSKPGTWPPKQGPERPPHFVTARSFKKNVRKMLFGKGCCGCMYVCTSTLIHTLKASERAPARS